MLADAFTSLLLTALVAVAASPGSATQTAGPPDLMTALGASDVAEIYIVSPSIQFPTAPRPETVREVGCKYLVYRESPQWGDLVRSLGLARIRMVPTSARGEVRVGLVLGDWRGTIREVYSGDLVWPDGRVRGFDQRRQVEISASFVAALQGFVARHRDLARADLGPSSNCPRQAR
jgi:hypothetical protein